MNGIVTSPQFDTEFFKVGQAVRVTWKHSQGSRSKDCLIIAATPLSLEICYWDDVRNEHQTEFIQANEVVQGRILIEKLQPIHKIGA